MDAQQLGQWLDRVGPALVLYARQWCACPDDVVQTAFLEPGAALDRLEYLLVITDYDGGLPSPDEQPINCDPEGDAGILPEGEQPCIVPTPKP